MINLSDQIEFLNSELRSVITNSKITNPKFLGVAEYILQYVDDKAKKLPVIREGKEFTPCTYDDINDLHVYHKIKNSQMIPGRLDKSFDRAYGDTSKNIFRVTDLSMIVFINSDYTQDEIANSLITMFPERVPKAKLENGLFSVNYELIGIDFETINIFRREFDGLEYDLNNEVKLIEVKYKIECSFSKTCINNCLS